MAGGGLFEMDFFACWKNLFFIRFDNFSKSYNPGGGPPTGV